MTLQSEIDKFCRHMKIVSPVVPSFNENPNIHTLISKMMSEIEYLKKNCNIESGSIASESTYAEVFEDTELFYLRQRYISLDTIERSETRKPKKSIFKRMRKIFRRK